MAFPLLASEISDKSETGREQLFSVPFFSPSQIVTFLPVKKVLYQRGQNVPFSGKDVTKNVTSYKNIFVYKSVTFFPKM